MRVVLILHPLRGDVKNNLEKIEAIGREINLKEPYTVPLCPFYFNCACLDDSNPVERARGRANTMALIEEDFIKEVRLYGPTITAGMRTEVAAAIENGIDVRPMTNGTAFDLKIMRADIDQNYKI